MQKNVGGFDCHISNSYLRYVNWWSLVPIECQQEFQIWGRVKKETLFIANSSIMTWHGCGTVWLWTSRAVRRPSGEEALGQGSFQDRQLCSTLPCSVWSNPSALVWPAPVCSGLLQPDLLGVWALAGYLHSSVKRESMLSEPKGSWLIEREFPPLVPDLSILMQTSTQNYQFDWPKKQCPDWSEWRHSDLLVKMLIGI